MARPTLLVAGLSVRQLAQAAAREGLHVVALDAFGDRDTRHAARRWQAWRGFDAGDLLDALHDAAAAGALGWIAGSGFEAHLDLLGAAALRLPLLGTPVDGWRLARDPRRFFPLLQALGLPHPPTRWDQPPAEPQGWLIKDGAACGGHHVRPAQAGTAPRGLGCWQRRLDGVPMSVALVADGRRALRLGFNEQLVGLDGAPYAWRGALGPLPVAPGVAAQIDAALQHLVPACGLRGLASLDFLLGADGGVSLLELNPRPGGTLQLYAPQAPLRLHLRACLGAPLPAQPVPQPVHALEVLYAPRPLRLTAAVLQRLARRGWVHDLPEAPVALAAREPVCSLSASAPQADAARALLRRRHEELTELLEDSPHELAC
jgi:predicted ATP-grasp superfamily ATP-dependent carboligase